MESALKKESMIVSDKIMFVIIIILLRKIIRSIRIFLLVLSFLFLFFKSRGLKNASREMAERVDKMAYVDRSHALRGRIKKKREMWKICDR